MDAKDILALFDRPVAFQPAFVPLTGSTNAALMLSQAFYWSKRTKDPNGWFYKSREEWESEIRLNRREQENARKLLRATGFWIEHRKGNPARLYYRIDAEAMMARIQEEPCFTLTDLLSQCKSSLTGLAKTGFMRAQKLGVICEYVDYTEVLKIKGMVCGICLEPITRPVGQKQGFLVFDHIKALNNGGEHVFNNLQPAHAECNGRKGDGLSRMSTVDRLDGLADTNKSVLASHTPRAPLSDPSEITTEITARDRSTKRPRQPGSFDERNDRSPKRGIEEMQSPPDEWVANTKAMMREKFPMLVASYNEIQEQWRLSRFRDGGIGKHRRHTATLLEYEADFQIFCGAWNKNHTNGNGYGNGAKPDPAKCDPDRPMWMAGQRKNG